MTVAGSAPTSDPVAPVLERLARLHPRVIDLSLDRILRLLERLGRPQDGLPPVVHVAGTNGKGSTLAFLRAMLEAAGYRVHVYTSPHLIHFRERIRLAGRLIDDATLTEVLEACETANAGDSITYFEITTAAAFLAFKQSPADVLLLETGLGGRLDATNVIARPAVTAITRISLDHQFYLGDTLAEIAFEKAGILKAQVPAVLAPQPEDQVTAVLRREATARPAPILPWSIRLLSVPDGQAITGEPSLLFDSPPRRIRLPAPRLPGAHQVINAGTAIACLAPLDFTVTDEAVRRGLLAVDWPARLQQLVTGRLADLLPPGWSLWVDGGHNDSAGAVLAEQAAVWAAESDCRPLLIVFGMLSNKQVDQFLGPLLPYTRRLRAVTIPGEPNSLSAEAAAGAAVALGFDDVAPASAVRKALVNLIRSEPFPHRILICGSLYLAGQVLSENGTLID